MKSFYFFMGTLCLILVLCIAVFVDSLLFDARYFYELTLDDACDYELPTDHDRYGRWVIMTDGKMFAVKRHWLDQEDYLCEHDFELTLYSTNITTPVLFFSECKAKAAIKCFIDDNYTIKKPF